MKRIILFCFALFIGITVNSQNQTKISTQLLNKSEKMMDKLNGTELPIILNQTNPYVAPKPNKDLGTQIGITWYDLQGNADVGNRMMVYADGSISAVWTMATESAFVSRGTGYNHSTDDGATWLPYPTARLEGSLKTGWPSIGRTPNAEIAVSHDFGVKANVCKTTDGGASWANTFFGIDIKLSWPRMVVNGNTIHVIGQTYTTIAYQGFAAGALVYLKSTDDGATWTAPIIPTGLDTSNYSSTAPFTDSYSLASKGDTIAIAYGDGFRTPCLVKSTNNGDTWSYREILHLPIKKFNTEGSTIYDINGDGQQDNIYGNDGVNFVALDANGKAHVFFGRQRYTDDGSGAGYNYFPSTDGLYYWNEDMGVINFVYKWTDISGVNTYEAFPDTVSFPIITSIVDINGNGTIDFPDNGSNYPFGEYYNSLSSQPNAVILPDGTIYVYYSSIVEGTDGTVGSEHKAFRNIWEIHKIPSAPNNFTWSTPVRIAEDDFTEEVWPCIAPYTYYPSHYAHLWYQGDGYPGNSLQPNTGNPHPVIENGIYYIKCLLDIGINETNVVKSAPVVYPNPASDYVNVKYNLTAASNVKLSIFNMMGQQMMTTNRNVTAGEVNVALNIESLPQGVYLIKSDIGGKSFSEKLLVK